MGASENSADFSEAFLCRSGTERLEMAPRALRHEERKYHFHERGRYGKGHLLRSALRSPRNRAEKSL